MKMLMHFFISIVKLTSNSDVALNERTANKDWLFSCIESPAVRKRFRRPVVVE